MVSLFNTHSLGLGARGGCRRDNSCSPFPLGPCGRFPGGLHAFRLEPPACWGLAYLQPAVPTMGRGSALSPLQTGRLSRSFLLEQKRMVRKRQGWPWQKETGKSSGSARPSFQPPRTWLQRGQGARAPSLAPCSSRAQHLPGISQGTCSREGPSSESSAAERRPCKNNSKDEAPPAVTLFTVQRTKKLSRKQRRKSVVHISFLHMTSSQGLAC